MVLPHLVIILFIFAFGACVGSFLNVVVWRLPRGASLVSPPSHCPICEHRLAWHDNIPVFGWLALRGRCRYCATDISARYPSIEFLTGAIFVFYYLMFYVAHIGPCSPAEVLLAPDNLGRIRPGHIQSQDFFAEWPIYVLYMFLLACLLAASLVDAEMFIIPLEIPWLAAAVGIIAHALIDRPTLPGAVSADPRSISGALGAGGGVGLLVSMVLYMTGMLSPSFPDGEPELEVEKEEQKPESPGWLSRLMTRCINAYRGELTEKQRELRRKHPKADAPANDPTGQGRPHDHPPRAWTAAEIRSEIRKEMTFLTPPLLGGIIASAIILCFPRARLAWERWMMMPWLSGLLGAVLGALVGGFIVWLTRIVGTLAKGRVVMGLGDAHLMFGVGAIIGAGPAAVAFFLAPFAGLAVWLYMWITRNRKGQELPYGPYLSLATAAVMLRYCPIADYLRPGIEGMGQIFRSVIGW